MGAFADDLRRYTVKVQARTNDVFTGTVDEAHRSIVEGSEITGSPGQQVDTGALRASWIKSYESPTEAVISTNVVYARQEEDGISSRGTAIVQRSEVGGPHSTALTIAGIGRIVEVVSARVAGSDA